MLTQATVINQNGKVSSNFNAIAYFLLFVAICLLPIVSIAQDIVKRPKIGLVLSGGGAKGFAHIGVLKVLEEAGIKIDYIGGTSMGAVVGGLYASGYNARQIDSIFKSTDFDKLLQDYIPRASKNFYEKKNEEIYALSLPFNKFKVGIPIALSKGLYNYNLLNQLTYHVRNVKDFSQLHIPFLCIATNIETGEEVVLKEGYLAQSMLASSAFPSVFAPVEIDDKMLVDGGITNNYPVEEVRKMGADIIIGVDVQDNLKDRKLLKEATNILVQISNLQMIEKMKKKKQLTDIYIKPNISDFNVISFEARQQIIKNGEDASFEVYEKIKALADQSNGGEIQNNKKISDSIFIKNIVINNQKNYTRSYVIGKLGFKQNEKISFQELKDGINTVNATQNFSAIRYKLSQNTNTNEDDLLLDLTENTSKTFLKFGLHYDGLFKSALLANITHKKAFFKNDVASIDIMLGDSFRYNFDYYIDNGFYWSFGIKSSHSSFNRNIGNGDLLNQFTYIDYSQFSNQMYVQTIFAQKFLLGLGTEWEHLKIKSETLHSTLQTSDVENPVTDNSNYENVFGYMKLDSFDNKYFPKKGMYFSTDFKYYLFSSDFSQKFSPFSITKADFGFAKTFFKKITFKSQTESGFTVGKETVPFFDFVFGGYGFSSINNIKPFFGYDFLSVSANSFIKTTATIDYEIIKKNHLNFAVNYANIGDKIFRTTDWISAPKFSGYAVGYGLETIIGPVEVKYTWSPELNKGFTWFAVGFWF
jgi:NTE family protein